ncbi:MAG: hypothetical protein LC437_09725, partial [Thiohalomonas sp.]|nr:hypothetical protein [Thiohalomonas sp.]
FMGCESNLRHWIFLIFFSMKIKHFHRSWVYTSIEQSYNIIFTGILYFLSIAYKICRKSYLRFILNLLPLWGYYEKFFINFYTTNKYEHSECFSGTDYRWNKSSY